MLAVIGTHPVQYHAPVYRALQIQFGIPVTAIYGSDFSVAGYRDREFGAEFAWDTDLLSGYRQVFLSRVSDGGAGTPEEVSARSLGKSLREIAPKAVLVLGYSTRFNQAAFYEAWRNRLPILFRGETTDHNRCRTRLKSLARDAILRLCYRHSARLLYIGERSYQHYKRLSCPDEKLIFSPYCVDVSSFEFDEQARRRLRPSLRKELGLSDKDIVLLFSGKLYHHKAPELIILAVKRLPADVSENIVVIYMGSGQLIDDLRKLAQEPPQVKVFFPGFQNQTRLSRYYHAADLLILPSNGETWGLVVNEALHHGLPCVVSEAVGCAPDLIESGVTGHIFVPGSPQSLASALWRAFELIRRDGLRLSCRQIVSGYCVENAARGIASAYNQVAGHEYTY
jgi:glycosyltransferase involved in cell wall biosynthesis